VIERKILSRESASDDSKEVLPVVFSLTHPHGEIVPVAIKQNGPGDEYSQDGTNDFVQDKDLRVVQCFEDLPLAVFYDASSRTHFVCWIRPVYEEENEYGDL
jgi:hypothetical protein